MPRKSLIWLVAGSILLLVMAVIAWRFSLPRGTVVTVVYESQAMGGERTMLVYLPPGYSKDATYPVLYLLHGAGDNETAWVEQGSVNAILDKLYAEKKLVPMIVVMPNCFIPATVSKTLEDDLLQDVIPYVDRHYATRADRESRAIAGVSLGGGRALSIGLKHLDTFAWVGGFSPSLAGKQPADLLADPVDMRTKLRLLWISCGDADPLMDIGRSLHQTLEEKSVPHVWHLGSGGHEWAVWKNDLALFAQRLFRE